MLALGLLKAQQTGKNCFFVLCHSLCTFFCGIGTVQIACPVLLLMETDVASSWCKVRSHW